MYIGIIGATGKAGRYIMREALLRNHMVKAFVRDVSKVKEVPTEVVEKDIFNLTVDDLKDLDVVVNAFGAPLGQEHLHVEAGRHLIDLLQQCKNTRCLVVGRAGSLFLDKHKIIRVCDTTSFPEAWRSTARNQLQNLNDLQNSSINWTFLSPSAIFDPSGPRTGHYIVGNDIVIRNKQQTSYVSYADYAVAVIDEIEKSEHINEHFTVASENNTSAS